MFKKNSEYRAGSLGGSVKLVLAAFMALAFVVALSSSAMAELKIDGQWSGSFGQYNKESKSGTTAATYTATDAEGFASDSQAQINFTGTGDMGTAKVRFRVRDSDASAIHADWAALRHHIYWNVNEQLKIGWWGASFGLGAALVGYSVNGGIGTLGDGAPIGDQWGGVSTFANQEGLDISFTTGGMNVGVVILEDCLPSCSYDVGQPGGAQGADVNTMSLVPYFKGSFGNLTVGAFLTSASGDQTVAGPNADDNQTIEASSFDAAVVFKTGGMSIAAEIGQTTQSPNSTIITDAGGNAADYGDLEGSTMGVGVRVAGLAARYSSVVQEVAVGTDTMDYTTTEISAAYTIPMGAVNLIPEFAQRSGEGTDSSAPTGVDEYSATFIALGASVKF